MLEEPQRESMIGRTIGKYRVISNIGRGGMGEVYLAQDEKLDRQVAIKLIAPDSIADESARRRLMREAKAAAQLDHPNICAVYEVVEEGPPAFIVMQYIRGETLSDRIKRKPAQLQEALNVIIQVADGLAEAHSRGIIHRDIKPQNIMLTARGLAKVLDFGLAKVSRDEQEMESEAETESLLTSPGAIKGTVPYMSPEQVKGEVIDHRSDIFSLGVVLYQIVTGHHPFNAYTTAEIIAAILTKEPAPLAHYLKEPPGALEKIAAKAMRKNKEERYQKVDDLLNDLKNFSKSLESTPPAFASESYTQRQGVVKANRFLSVSTLAYSRIKQNKKVAVPLVILPVLIGTILLLLPKTSAPVKQHSFEAMTLTRLTTNGKAIQAALSPDGKYLAYVMGQVGEQSLWVRHIPSASDAQKIPPGTSLYSGLTLSPDGNFIYYVSGDSNNQRTLYRIPVVGGTPRKVLAEVDTPISFSTDGSRFAFIRRRAKSLMIANADGTEEHQLATFGEDGLWFSPAWSPDETIIACAANNANSNKGFVVGVSVKDGTVTPVGSQKWGRVDQAGWLSDGSGLVLVAVEQQASASQIWTLSYPEGETRRITNDLNDYYSISLTANSDSLSCVRIENITNIWTVPIGKASLAKQVTYGAGKYEGLLGISWVPDGRLAYTTGLRKDRKIFIMNVDGSNQIQLTLDEHANYFPSVSPDGRYVVFASNRGGADSIWRMEIEGSNLKQLTNKGTRPQCSPDGQWIVYDVVEQGKSTLWKVPAEGGDPEKLSDENLTRPAVSPDGRLIACELPSQKPGSQLRLAIIPIEGGQPIQTVEIPFISHVTTTFRWSPDGRALTYIANSGGVCNIWSQPLDGGPAKQLTDFKSDRIFYFEWSQDGKQLVCSRGMDASDAVLITNFK